MLITDMYTQSQDPFSFRDLFKPEQIYSFVIALCLLGASYILEHFANSYELEYSLRPTSQHVGDILLDNLPVINLNLLVVEGALLSLVFVTLFIIFWRPRYLLFTLKAVALFIAVRAFFISLTHVGIYPGTIDPNIGFFTNVYSYLNLQMGFFFSGHTGMPFLIALIFWKEFPIRAVLLTLSFIFAVAVLFAHVHYSIDVFAAPFMAYGIFKMAQHFFARDYKLTLFH